MKENKKYYTPEIEEFHVGFEYEFYGHNGWSYSLYGGFLPRPMSHYIEMKEVRVKHLDREDIESLGFKERVFRGYSDELTKFPISTSKDPEVYRGVISEKVLAKQTGNFLNGERGLAETHLIVQEFKFGFIISRFNYLGDKSFNIDTIFKGKIKNKNELRKLLKQLGI